MTSHQEQMDDIMRQQEEMMKAKMGAGDPKKKKAPLIQKDHKYFDSLDYYKKVDEESHQKDPEQKENKEETTQ